MPIPTLNFGAPQTYRHTWYAPDMKTPAVTALTFPKADDIDVSHYGTRQHLVNTTINLKRCQECHGVKDKGTYSMDYGNARIVPNGHNDMGSTPVDCEMSCHNSAIDVNNYSIPVVLHNNSVGVYLGSNSCNSPGCHTPPEPPDEGTR